MHAHLRGRWIMWLGLALGLAAMALGHAWGGNAAEQWLLAARYTARVGFPLLILAYVARPLVDLTRSDWSKSILAQRKYFGLGFAVSHTIHLVALVIAIEVSGQGKGIVTYIFGGLGYALLYAMAFTSNRSAMKAMGARWKTLHRIGIHYLWFIFAQSYAGRIFQDGKIEEGVIGATIVFGAAAIRFMAWRQARTSKRASPA